MNASRYFELVDAVANVDSFSQLKVVADLIAATDMHPLERRVLDRALRARTEALAIQQQLLMPDLFSGTLSEHTPLESRG